MNANEREQLKRALYVRWLVGETSLFTMSTRELIDALTGSGISRASAFRYLFAARNSFGSEIGRSRV